MKVIIMCGVPGSGKTRWVNERFSNKAVVCSADEFRMVDGEYRFVPGDHTPHKRCMEKFLYFTADLQNTPDVIVVDNTNCKIEDLAPYVAIAESYDAEIEIRWITADISVAFARQTHGVPLRTIERMQIDLLNMMGYIVRNRKHRWCRYVKTGDEK